MALVQEEAVALARVVSKKLSVGESSRAGSDLIPGGELRSVVGVFRFKLLMSKVAVSR